MHIIGKRMDQSEIGYMVNPTLHVNNEFRDQAEKCLKQKFHSNTHFGIKCNKERKCMCYFTSNVLRG